MTSILFALVLYVFVEHGKSLIDLLLQLVVVVDAIMVSNANDNGAVARGTYSVINSGLSISSNIPVILPANSGCSCWIFG